MTDDDKTEGTLEERIGRIRIKEILETPEQARQIVYEIVRCGLEVSPENIITEIVYQSLDRSKDDTGIEHFRNNKIQIDERSIDTTLFFPEKFPGISVNSFLGAEKTLIEWTFGKGLYEPFVQAQKWFNSTGFQRVGGEDLKDAHYIVHSARVLGRLAETGATSYQKLLGLFHDVIEDLTEYRLEQLRKLEFAKNSLIERAREVRKRVSSVSGIVASYDALIQKLQGEIDTPPEYDEIRALFRTHFMGEYNNKTKADALASLGVYHLGLLTRRILKDGKKEAYDKYVIRLEEGSGSSEVTGNLQNAGIDIEEEGAMQFYIAPLVAKAIDSYDNTDRMKEMNITRKKERLRHNILVIAAINHSIEDYGFEASQLARARDELVRISRESLKREIDYFGADDNRHIMKLVRDFEKLGEKYEQFGGKQNRFYELVVQAAATIFPGFAGRST